MTTSASPSDDGHLDLASSGRSDSEESLDTSAAPKVHPTRRSVLLGGAALAAAAGSASTAAASGGTHTSIALQNEPRGLTKLSPWYLGRASYGVTPAMLQDVHARGLKGWLDWQLEPELIDDSELDPHLVPFDWIGQSVVEMWNHPTKSGREIGYEARALRLTRATFSKRQLFERVVEFWTDHFNVFGSADDLWLLKIVDDQEVIRQHALGTFRDLLQASAKSAGMLEYLDNDTNVVGAPQENYAREVMELHTLGVEGPYTETDVRELARCLTGRGYFKLFESTTQYGEYRYRANKHDTDAKTVLGVVIPAGGQESDADTVLDFLADHPSTIDFVTTKLAKWFLGYSPPVAAIDAAKATWVATGGDIKEIVRTLLNPRFVMQSAPWENPKLKRPIHWVASLYRTTGITIGDPVSAILGIASLGHTSFDWEPPTGYPDTEEAWASLLIWRWNYATKFSQGLDTSLNHTINDLRALLGATSLFEWVPHLSTLMMGGTMDKDDVQDIQTYINAFGIPSDDTVAEVFQLVASSPSFGRY